MIRRRLTVPVLVNVAVLMPITRPEESRSGPPEFPGLIAASVCSPAICYQGADSVASSGRHQDICNVNCLCSKLDLFQTTVMPPHSKPLLCYTLATFVNEELKPCTPIFPIIMESWEGQTARVHACCCCASSNSSAQTLITVHSQGDTCICDPMHQ